jgi:hypothetical protein
VIVVRRHAVPAVAVEVQADAVERGEHPRAHAPRGLGDRGGQAGLRWIEREVRGEAWHVDLAVVHPAPLRLPVDLVPQQREPGFRDRLLDEARQVDDPPPGIVGQEGLGGIEERELRRGHLRTTSPPP